MTIPKEWTTLGEHIAWYNQELDKIKEQYDTVRKDMLELINMVRESDEKDMETHRYANAAIAVLELYSEQNKDLLACMQKIDPDYKIQG